jgi:hypothetical protein
MIPPTFFDRLVEWNGYSGEEYRKASWRMRMTHQSWNTPLDSSAQRFIEKSVDTKQNASANDVAHSLPPVSARLLKRIKYKGYQFHLGGTR